MAQYNVTAPDGTKYQVNAPDNATQEQVMAYVQSQHAPTSNADPQQLAQMVARDKALGNDLAASKVEAYMQRNNLHAQPLTAQQQAQATANLPQAPNVAFGNGVGGSLAGAGLGLVHHLANIPLGIAQLATNTGAAIGVPGAQGAAQAFNGYMQNREQNYQDVTRGNVGSYVGATVGEIAPWVAGVGALRGAGALPEVTSLGGKMAAGAAGGAAMGAVAPVTSPDYWSQKAQQVGGDAALGGALPAVGAGLSSAGGAVRDVARLATNAGRDKLADARLTSMLSQLAPTDFSTGRPDLNALAMQLGSVPKLVPGEQIGIGGALKTPQAIQLERTLRTNAQTQVPLANADVVNDAARMNVLRGLAGTDDELDAAIAARRANAQPFIDNNLTLQLPAERWGNALQPLQDALNSRMSGADRDAINQAINIAHHVRGGTLQEDDALEGLQPLNDAVTSKTAQDAFQSARNAIGARMVEPQPILDTIARQRLTALGQNPTVARAMNTITSGIANARHATGNIPVETLDGIRRNIGRILADSAPANPAARIGTQEQAGIAPIEDAITQTLNRAVPGYSDYLAQYARDSVPINTMEGTRTLLGADRMGSLNGAGDKVPTATAINAFLRHDANARFGISPAARAQVEAVRDSMERANMRNVKLGTQGSDTAQLMRLPTIGGVLTPWRARMLGMAAGGALGHFTGSPYMGALMGGGLGLGAGEVGERALTAANNDILSRVGYRAADSQRAAQILRAARAPDTPLARALRLVQQNVLPYQSP